MRAFRSRLAGSFITAIAIALIATFPLEMMIEIVAQKLELWAVAEWNHFLTLRFFPIVEPPYAYPGLEKLYIVQWGAALAEILALWLFAIWVYPETEAPLAEK